MTISAPETTLEQSLALTLRHTFGDVLDLPIFAPGEVPTLHSNPSALLEEYAQQIRFCEACSFHIGRAKLVFGRGHWSAKIAFIGDFPSKADDQKGEPFADETGALLHKMILAMKVKPEEAYLTNIYKCRPATNDRGSAAHFLSCQKHLVYQFSQVNAPVIVALGDEAARCLARSESPLQVLRKQVFEWQGRRVICTHHPRDLHHSPALKKETWDDLKIAMRELERPT